ncbi:MAG: response regulator [Anaerolineae bacterium]|jgi:DNA-binding response OmpR family regulator
MSEGKVVVIEADQTIVGMLRGPFAKAGFDLQVAATGQEGLELCRRWMPQAVLVGLALPDMDGLEICRELRATTRTRHTHLVILATYSSREERLEALEMGVNDYIEVPFDPDEITLRVRNAVRRAAADNLTDPVTGLPSGRMIRRRLRDLLRQRSGWALLGINIQHLDAFEGAHGFLAVQETLRSVVRVLGQAVEEWGDAEDFVGHSGGGRFVVITKRSRADGFAQGVATRVEEELEKHHTFREREQGHVVLRDEGEVQELSLLGVDVRMVAPADGPFYDIRSLTEALG